MSRISEVILSLHGWLALLVVFLLPALESSVFFGFLFPGEIAVILGGVLAFQHRIDLDAAIAVAVSGAVIGDSVGYTIGRRWGRRMLQGFLGRFVKSHHLDQAERFLAKHGGKAVFLGRWTAALRVLIPGLAGMSRVRYRTFAVWNVLGGGLWATSFVLVGFAAGEGWRKVEAVAKRASLVLLLIVILVLGIVLLARWVTRHPERVRAALDRQLARPAVARLRVRYERQLAFMARRLRPGGALGLSLTLGLAGIGLAGWAFGAVLQEVLARENLTQFDQVVQTFFSEHREAWLTGALRAGASVGASGLLLAIALAAGLSLRMARGRWLPLGLLLGAYGGAQLLAVTVQTLVRRPHPPGALVAAGGFAFPSREATAAVAVYGLLAVLGGARSRWSWRVSAWTAATLGVVLLALAQVYLGAHWLSDVLGGWALAGLWLLVLGTVVRTLTGWRAGTGRTQEPERVPEVKA
ncbi:MAG TPA: VTT domain-containing protein [Actinomycetes bacterium]|nr:VTT domain-containing protein [Actinomycetes bacterium]